MTDCIKTVYNHIWHNGEDVMVHLAPLAEMGGEYEGYTYRIKGDDRVELIAQDGSTTMHQTVGNALAWVDQQGGTETPPETGPAITSIDPASVAVSDGEFMLTVTGTGFTGDAQVVVDGVEMPTAHGQDPNVIAAQVVPVEAGEAAVTVRQASGESAPVPLTFT